MRRWLALVLLTGCGAFSAAETGEHDDAGASDAGASEAGDAGASDASLSPFAKDSFSRTAVGGLGVAELGGPWTIAQGAPVMASVADGVAKLALTPGKGSSHALLEVARLDADVEASYASGGFNDADTNALYVGLMAHRQMNGDHYLAEATVKSSHITGLKITAKPAGVVVMDAPANVALKAGDLVRLRLVATGRSPTRLRFKAWRAGDPEPDAWPIDVNDTRPSLEEAGGVGIFAFLSANATGAATVTADDFVAR